MPNPPPLQPDVCYHIYNRGNNGEDLFPELPNYAYFLKLYAHHVSSLVDTFKRGFVTNLDDWPYSSYHALKSTGVTKLKRDEVIGWFGNRQHFVDSHTKFAPDAWLTEQDFDV